jgi:hypothetical protein
MFKKIVLTVALTAAMCSTVLAEDGKTKFDINELRKKGYSVNTVTPIFGQLLMFSFPQGFKFSYEDAKNVQYIQESVLEGETVNKWSQMISVTGTKGLAANSNVTPQELAGRIATGFKRACPDTFSAKGLGSLKISGQDAFVAWVGCGVAQPAGGQHSESALVLALKGGENYYTIQWAERGPASNTPIVFDEAKWTSRFKQLNPIEICALIPAEPAPYPSCTTKKEVKPVTP